MTITLYWWAIPLAVALTGWAIAGIYYRKNYSPSGYFGDFVTPFIAAVIFGLSLLLAIGICIGRWLA